MRRFFLFLAAAVLVLASCENESYESGDTALSYVRADFALLHTAQPQTADYAVTDDGERLTFSPAAHVSWAEKADSLYRALVYYARTGSVAEAKGVQQVLVAQLRYPEGRRPATDPLVFESAWRGGGYLNVGFAVKTGVDGEMKAQSIGFLCDSVVSAPADTTVFLTMLHSQNGAPEYYSTRAYVSLPAIATRHYVLRANTYKGWVEKRVE